MDVMKRHGQLERWLYGHLYIAYILFLLRCENEHFLWSPKQGGREEFPNVGGWPRKEDLMIRGVILTTWPRRARGGDRTDTKLTPKICQDGESMAMVCVDDAFGIDQVGSAIVD